MARLEHVKMVFTLPVTLSGFGQVSDGEIVIGPDERVLVTGNGAGNGIYNTTALDWVRSPDLANSADFTWPIEIDVKHGNTYHDSIWYYASADSPTLGVDTLYFRLRWKAEDDVGTTENNTQLDGLVLYYENANTIGVTPGTAHIQGLGKAVKVEANMTANVPTGTNNMTYCYLEEYPSGSGLGRLRLITTAPAAPYLGNAAYQAGDPTTRYLGIVKRDNSGNVIPFEDEAMGGGTVFRQYTLSHTSTSLTVVSEYTGLPASTNIGPSATLPINALVPASAETVWLLGYARQTTGAASVARIGKPTPGSGTPAGVVGSTGNVNTYAYQLAALDNGLLHYAANVTGLVMGAYVAGYYDRR